MLNKVKSLKYVQRLADLGERSCNTMLLALKLYFFTSTGNNSYFSISSLFHQKGKVRNGAFLYIYTMYKVRKTGDGKGVCTRVANRVHTVSRVSSDILLQSVHTPNRRCAHGQRGMCLQIDGMYNYTIRLYIYAKQAARESRICARLFFRTKISENSTWVING